MKGGGLFISKQIIKYDEGKKKEYAEKQRKRRELSEMERVKNIIAKNPSGKPPPLPWEIVSNFPDPNESDLKKGSKSKKKSKKVRNRTKSIKVRNRSKSKNKSKKVINRTKSKNKSKR